MGVSSEVGRGREGSMVVNRILDAIADREQCDIFELPPLYEAVDPDALDAVVRGVGVTEVSFQYYGYRVSIEGSGDVRVSPQYERFEA